MHDQGAYNIAGTLAILTNTRKNERNHERIILSLLVHAVRVNNADYHKVSLRSVQQLCQETCDRCRAHLVQWRSGI